MAHHVGEGTSRYDRYPTTVVAGYESWGADGFWAELSRFALDRAQVPIIAIDCYPGVDVEGLIAMVVAAAPEWSIIDVEDAAASSTVVIDELVSPHLTEDRVFGVMSHFSVESFYDADALVAMRERLAQRAEPTVLVGWGAAMVAGVDVIVSADLARWEIQTRQRAGAPNWRCDNGDEDNLRKYKRGFFVEWPAADQHKAEIADRIDYVLDTNRGLPDLTLATSAAIGAGMEQTVRGPFRVVPFFDPGVWGGQWMKEVCGLDSDAVNYAWCFDCVPEENSLYLEIGGRRVELPAKNLVVQQAHALLGDEILEVFGAEFPIRFDFLDTMEGGNLSLQVHPLIDYIQSQFGMAYTQDESYYILDAAPGAEVYLGLKEGVDRERMLADVRRADAGEISFPAGEYVNTHSASKHDHFLIPAGTVHCSGADTMVLEISATPFIFTFKMWDWDRVGLDGVPRPISIDHAAANIQWDRDTAWVGANLVDQVEEVAEGDGWTEERTGLHELEFIDTRRHWFTGPVSHDTLGTVRVINLVEGREVTVESPDGSFDPFVVHYAETFIVPAGVGEYTITPTGPSAGSRCATLTASVRLGTAESALGRTIAEFRRGEVA